MAWLLPFGSRYSGICISSTEPFRYEIKLPYAHVAWLGRITASAGVAASLSAEAVENLDNEHTAMLAGRSRAKPSLSRTACGLGRLGPSA